MAADSESNQRREAGLALVVTEFEFVSGLIPFYRRVELTALGGSGFVVSAALTAYTALTNATSVDTDLVAAVLAAAAWGPALLLLVEAMALTRLIRASRYIEQHLHPLAAQLSGDKQILCWELAPTESLIGSLTRRQWAAKLVVTSIPVIAIMAAAAIGLGVLGIATQATTVSEALAISAIVLTVPVAAYGARLTWRHETRRRTNGQGDPEVQRRLQDSILFGVAMGALVACAVIGTAILGVHALGFV